MALLEQNRSRLASVQGKEDDETLEEMFLQAVPASDAPIEARAGKKKTKQDLIRELKAKRLASGSAAAESYAEIPTDDTKKSGKFKPIGFKPVGGGVVDDKRKRKTEEGITGEKKKKRKKRKVEPGTGEAGPSKVEADFTAADTQDVDMLPPSVSNSSQQKQPPPEIQETSQEAPVLEVEPDDDGDIFAGAGEYEGLIVSDDGDDEDEDEEKNDLPPQTQTDETQPVEERIRTNWFNDEPEANASPLPAEPTTALSPQTKVADTPQKDAHDSDEDMDEEQPMRLQPLHSSAIPSIKDLLQMDSSVGKRGGKGPKKRKAKKKGGEEGDKSD
jgi:IK cytokine